MHLLAAKPGGFSDEEGIVDLQQDPADIVILAAQDSTLSALDLCLSRLPEDYPSVRIANLVHIAKPAAFDLYANRVLSKARVVILFLLGGKGYFEYGLEQIHALKSPGSLDTIVVTGDDQWDASLLPYGTVEPPLAETIWKYLRQAISSNLEQFYHLLENRFFCHKHDVLPPRMLAKTQLFGADTNGSFVEKSLKQCQTKADSQVSRPRALVLFYRSHLESANMQALHQFFSLAETSLNTFALAVSSLKDPDVLATVHGIATELQVNVVLNTTAFSICSDGSNSPFGGCVVLQCILAANDVDDWAENLYGLRARDIAMNIALPEMDGRVIGTAIAFKDALPRSERSQYESIAYRLEADQAKAMISLASAWAKLSRKANSDKRIALVLANYPMKDGRIGNGVGLDTPASAIQLLHQLKREGYQIDEIPDGGDQLIEKLLENVTNNLDWAHVKSSEQSLSLEDYYQAFKQLPLENQQQVIDQWGPPEKDPKFRQGRLMIAGIHLNNCFVGIQPSRGFNMDVAANYHSPDLIPPHSYLAFYFWMRTVFKIDALMHLGKHGNLEWLPGKGVALSQYCWPRIALGEVPHLYPFIVNDPGEGAQAKRRAHAVIIDHLMPPMARAESYGQHTELEDLLDELYQAMGVDERRERLLKQKVVQLAHETHILADLKVRNQGLSTSDEEQVLNELDAYLCELKEAQIRDGLHILGTLPAPKQQISTLACTLRNLRSEQGHWMDALCADVAIPKQMLGHHIEDHDVWSGPRPDILNQVLESNWRSVGDTRERAYLLLEHCTSVWCHKQDSAELQELTCKLPNLIAFIESHRHVVENYQASPSNELDASLNGFDGRHVLPGPSGALTRGRADILPTGRNFYSLDHRSVPTSAAWELGQKSAEALIARHLQEEGDYPQHVGLSVWGTATMRTGGDDIAQAFALMGIEPVWDPHSRRLTDFKIQPAFILNRPRVDVTLRISGFFRDAFPHVIHVFDAAARALAEFDEPGNTNTIRHKSEALEISLTERGLSDEEAKIQSRARVFGSKPGAYGAGLQGLIDERAWKDSNDLAEAYLQWGGYWYGQESDGQAAHRAFAQQIAQVDAVVQNQDNREHDILDSDDYYQFQGGMVNAVTLLSGESPASYLNDHSNIEHPQIRSLEQELNRVIRSRVLNPKWIAGMQRHGYKGGFEMAATVDYLFAYDATTNLVADHHYDQVVDTLILDPDNQAFLKAHNLNALQEMTERMLEAAGRDMWETEPGRLDQLRDLALSIEDTLEMNQG